MFIDEAKIFIKSGDGGNGCLSFRREKFVPRGGPDGGNGGRGGDVFIAATTQMHTLSDFKAKVHFKAQNGSHGKGSLKNGKDGEDLIIKVSVGTQIFRADNNELLADLVSDGDKAKLLSGGRGGRGNTCFKTSTRRVPRITELGEPGKELQIKLELKLIADVGIIGFPNSGKSTLLSKISSAHPKIADYPFTTLAPNLGVAYRKDKRIVFADIPGLIEGAHQGAGLGDKFLRHIQRTRLLVHLIDLTAVDLSGSLKQYYLLNRELESYSLDLKQKPQIIVGNKLDLLTAKKSSKVLKKEFKKIGIDIIFISALTGEGLDAFLKKVNQALKKLPEISKVQPKKPLVCQKKDASKTKITKCAGGFKLEGENIEKIVAMINWETPDAVDYFQERLKRLKINEALKAHGAKTGDNIKIRNKEFEYLED